MHRLARITAVVATFVAAALIVVSASGKDLSPRFGEVELLRDSWGVPHVFAETDEGAMYGLGYAAAQDRGFQMHYFLRMIQGRMSEVFGVVDKKTSGVGQHNTLDHDRVMRTFGFSAAAKESVKNLDPETRGLLEAYSAGVNDYFANNQDREHYLFRETGLKREPWAPSDCLLSWWHLAQFFSKNGLRDQPHLNATQTPRGRPMVRVQPDDSAAVVRREDVSDEWIAKVNAWAAEMGFKSGGPKGPGDPDPKFSHAWVVGGKKTTTGASVLVSDPQTPVWNPSVLYEFHIKGATFNTRGVGVAGSPVILIGFNQRVAWGMTALGADQADIFILKTDADHPDQYQVDGKWLEMQVEKEVIRIKGSNPATMTVRKTIFGPIVSEFVWQNPEGQEVALSRIPMAETDRDTIQGALGMMRSGSCDEFAAALPGWRFPTGNCIFGDDQGNIGYWSLGALPLRSQLTGLDGSHAQDGTTRKGMWRGMIPYDVLPHCMNPKRGYLVSANHRSIQSFYGISFGNMTGNSGDTDRGLRIKEQILAHLDENDKFKPEDVLAVHYDSVNVWKREIVRLGYKALRADPDQLSPNSKQALRYLHHWYENGASTDMSVPGTELVNEISVNFRGGVFGLVSQYGGGVGGLARFAKTVRARDAADPNSTISDDEREFADMVLGQAWKRTESKYGPDSKRWNALAKQELCRQKLGYMESLDGFPALDHRYDVPLPLLTTVDGATVLSQKGQSYTQFVPLHNPDESLSILPIGHSEDPLSPYRFSTYGDWAQGKLHPAPLSRSAVGKIAVSQETLGQAARPERRRAAQRGPERTRARNRRQPAQTRKTPLPGKKPDDPTLEMAIRYMNRPERTEQQVKAKIDELRSYVADNDSLKAELVAGLELFTHLMRESQAGRISIRYGSPQTLKQMEAFYRELAKGGRR